MYSNLADRKTLLCLFLIFGLQVEERVLEEFAWSLESPLWSSLQRRADGVPSSQAVSLEAVEGYSVRQPSLPQRYNVSPIKPLGKLQ